MFLRVIIIAIGIFSSTQNFAQASGKLSFGLEQDVLPYITGGYFAGAWVGQGHVRGRALLARVNKPDFIIKEGFSNNRVTAYALVADYFLKDTWMGWWAGSGIVYWKSSIQSEAKTSTVYYKNTLVNGSLGYNIRLHKNIYVSPWACMHLKIAGDKFVNVDGNIFKPPLLNPEASVKVGWFFQ